MHELEFHFDFLSPYGYFGSHSIEELARRHDLAVDWCPMLLGVSVMKVMGLKPLLDTPLKGDYVRRDVGRLSRLLNLPLGRALDRPPQSSLVPSRAVCWAKRHAPQIVPELVHAIYAAMWATGIDINDPEDLARIEITETVDIRALVSAVAGVEAGNLLRLEVERSIAKGVFGSPTVVVNGEPFWGFDRFEQVDRWLASGGW
ncbi:2-hydroxychromene-2-carboxylate isomerase [Comamonas sp. Tr-654]|uniref:2-hydroxychromene-2-carboxylate isomerase n=1 Tax=Comamonas sp. Tr-654 TaxID=2608341 RepID=UPI00141E19A2|nr:2-hydroxychromene-2-carboxylate isomerase [Comamonas sp. Tr-654]NIF82690.1 2-hydroxychromene-2-carboxylate isomerase [Comamonas sp. Tr-654]